MRNSVRARTLVVGWCLLTIASTALAARAPKDDKLVDIPVGGSTTVRVPAQIDRVVVGDPQVCDVVPLPPGQLLLTARAPGETQISVWSRDGGVSSYHVVASAPIAALQQALRDAFPGEEDLQARAAGGAVYLTGSVSDPFVVEAAQRLASNLLTSAGRKAADIVNLTSVSQPQQVQVQLRFVEVTRTSLRNMGFNAWFNRGSQVGSMFGPNDPRAFTDNQQPAFQGPYSVDNPNNLLPILLSPIRGAFSLSFASGRFGPMSATLALLEGRGLAKTLSQPTLVASSGERAKFLVGGEFPIPVPDALGRVVIQFKEYGAQLQFTPTVVSQDTVHLALDTIVSDIDASNKVTVGGTSVPGLTTRQST
ncbi:MAG TPA: pilus assembly protein N-terminal domain-containing protein, partial [Myxococcota bacterium]|nr:pilus assembly protein N-terminal domain-containing protein [Myxococcota bacterium]